MTFQIILRFRQDMDTRWAVARDESADRSDSIPGHQHASTPNRAQTAGGHSCWRWAQKNPWVVGHGKLTLQHKEQAAILPLSEIMATLWHGPFQKGWRKKFKKQWPAAIIVMVIFRTQRRTKTGSCVATPQWPMFWMSFHLFVCPRRSCCLSYLCCSRDSTASAPRRRCILGKYTQRLQLLRSTHKVEHMPVEEASSRLTKNHAESNSLIEWKSFSDEKDSIRHGVCSTWLNDISPGEMVPSFVRGWVSLASWFIEKSEETCLKFLTSFC